MSDELMKKELQEAIRAGKNALKSLEATKEKLGSASNWGVFDMLGGGLFSNMIKHSKLDETANLMTQAKCDLQVFQKELKDVQLSINLGIDISGSLKFADYFLDGVVTDYLVQNKISDARYQVDSAICQVE